MQHRTAFLSIAIAAAGVFAVAGCDSSISAEIARDRQLDTDMAAVTDTGVPGVALVIRDGDNTTRLAHGVGESATNTPLQVDDQFRIGSLSKSYVAVVMLQLVDEDRLALDDSIERWVPGLVPNGGEITVRQLLNHTSGIPNYEEHPDYMAPYLAGDFGHVTTPQQLVDMGTSQRDAVPAGHRLDVLEHELHDRRPRHRGGHRHDAGRAARPAHLRAVGARAPPRCPTDPEIEGTHAHGYFVLGQPPATDVTRFSPSIGWAGGGIVSTTDRRDHLLPAPCSGASSCRPTCSAR